MYPVYKNSLKYVYLFEDINKTTSRYSKSNHSGSIYRLHSPFEYCITFQEGNVTDFKWRLNGNIPFDVDIDVYPFNRYVTFLYGIPGQILDGDRYYPEFRDVLNSEDNEDDERDDDDDDWDDDDENEDFQNSDKFLSYCYSTPYTSENLPNNMIWKDYIDVDIYHKTLDELYNDYIINTEKICNYLEYKISSNIYSLPMLYMDYNMYGLSMISPISIGYLVDNFNKDISTKINEETDKSGITVNLSNGSTISIPDLDSLNSGVIASSSNWIDSRVSVNTNLNMDSYRAAWIQSINDISATAEVISNISSANTITRARVGGLSNEQ